jgi:hypothetical protein
LHVNCTGGGNDREPTWPSSETVVLTWAFALERVTGIEPALSVLESVHSGPSIWPDLRSGLSVSDRESPRFTRVNGPLMARLLNHVEGRPSSKAGHIPSWHESCESYALLPVAAGSRWPLLLLSPLLSSARYVRAPGTFQSGPVSTAKFLSPPLPPIGLTAAVLFAGAEVSRLDLRVR